MKKHPVVEKLMQEDAYSHWLQVERLEEGPGVCVLRMKVRAEMVNGFGIAHGAITYGFADSALAFASNAHGRHSVSIETSISHLKPVKVGDVLTTHVEEKSLGNRLGVYHIELRNQDKVKVALFQGTVYRKDTLWEV